MNIAESQQLIRKVNALVDEVGVLKAQVKELQEAARRVSAESRESKTLHINGRR